MELKKIDLAENGFLRLSSILKIYPVSKATWWSGCRNGKFPKPYKLSPKVTAWRISDINALLDSYQKKN